MTTARKTITIFLWVLVVVGLLGLVALERRKAQVLSSRQPVGTVMIENPDGSLVPLTTMQTQLLDEPFDAPTFSLTDQSGQTFSSDQLKGKVWTAMLFFSECQGVCPGMTGRITDLQKAIADPDVHFVSFTVDPANDTPERLATYAKMAGADSQRWHMLTGPLDQLKSVGVAMKLRFDVPTDHSSRILLIDGSGKVRGTYNSTLDDDMSRLKIDAAAMVNRPLAG